MTIVYKYNTITTMHTTQKPYIILVQGFDQKTIKVLSRIISKQKLLQKIYNIENIKDRKDCVNIVSA